MRRLPPLLLAVASALALSAAPAHAFEPIEPLGSQLRLTQQGADGDFTRDTFSPAVVYNSRHNEFLAVWEDRTAADSQVFGRRLAADGTPLGAAFQISGVGPDAGIHDARDPAVAYDFERDRYGVAYTHPNGSAGRELFLQLIGPAGTLIRPDGSTGPATNLLSSVGGSSDPDRGVLGGASLAYVPDANGDASPGDRWVAAYSGDEIADDSFMALISAVDAGDGATAGKNLPVSDASMIDAFDPVLTAIPGTDQVAVAWGGAQAPNDFEIYARRIPPSMSLAEPQLQLSAIGDAVHNGFAPALAADAEHGQLIVAFQGNEGNEGNEIYVQRLNLQLDQIGADDQQITVSGPAGSGNTFAASLPAVSYMPSLDRFLVTWVGTDNDRAGLANGEKEVSGTVLDPNGVEAAPQDFVISHMGDDGRLQASPFEARIAANTATGRWLPVWNSDDARAPLSDDEFELWGRQVGEDFDRDHDGARIPQDCDDADAAIHPGAKEIVGNGIDEDCSGADAVDPDRDRDGSARPADCDDGNPFIHPGAADIAGNGVDEDCAGGDAQLPAALTRATIARFFAVFADFTRVTRLVVKHVRPGMRIELRCKGRGCPRPLRGGKPRKAAVRKAGRVRLTKLFKAARLRPRAVIELRVSEPGAIARVDRYVIRDRNIPKQISRCLPPGATKPGACPT